MSASETGSAPGLFGMRLKIGVMGGATGELSREVLDKAHRLGREIARHGCILVTGGGPGLPQAAACGAKQEGGMVVGISPGLSLVGARTQVRLADRVPRRADLHRQWADGPRSRLRLVENTLNLSGFMC